MAEKGWMEVQCSHCLSQRGRFLFNCGCLVCKSCLVSKNSQCPACKILVHQIVDIDDKSNRKITNIMKSQEHYANLIKYTLFEETVHRQKQIEELQKMKKKCEKLTESLIHEYPQFKKIYKQAWVSTMQEKQSRRENQKSSYNKLERPSQGEGKKLRYGNYGEQEHRRDPRLEDRRSKEAKDPRNLTRSDASQYEQGQKRNRQYEKEDRRWGQYAKRDSRSRQNQQRDRRERQYQQQKRNKERKYHSKDNSEEEYNERSYLPQPTIKSFPRNQDNSRHNNSHHQYYQNKDERNFKFQAPQRVNKGSKPQKNMYSETDDQMRNQNKKRARPEELVPFKFEDSSEPDEPFQPQKNIGNHPRNSYMAQKRVSNQDYNPSARQKKGPKNTKQQAKNYKPYPSTLASVCGGGNIKMVAGQRISRMRHGLGFSTHDINGMSSIGNSHAMKQMSEVEDFEYI